MYNRDSWSTPRHPAASVPLHVREQPYEEQAPQQPTAAKPVGHGTASSDRASGWGSATERGSPLL